VAQGEALSSSPITAKKKKKIMYPVKIIKWICVLWGILSPYTFS
jgi:hypothetical protein